MLQISTTSELQDVLNYPLIFFVIVVVVYLLYKIMKRRQIESTRDNGWLENGTTTTTNQ